MALYEYECEVHKVFEVKQSMKDDALTECPHCKEEGKITAVKRLISRSNFTLIGGGWAKDNYK
jgi:putative FmdB family regulatory protein